jgi:Ca-activated chloride channel family protein
MMIRLANPSFLLIGVVFLALFLRKREVAFLGYSHLNLLEGEKSPRFWHALSKVLLVLVISLMILGFARPQWKSLVRQKSFLARDILLVMDLSLSMESGFEGPDGTRKIDVAKSAATQFIESRKTDRIGLLVFGDETFGSWPLTRDLKLILKKVSRLGSTFYGGTDLAKPFMKAMDHFREMGQTENRVLVYLSDGEAVIPPKVKEAIIARLSKMDIHLYLVGVQVKQESSDILEIVKEVGGKFINVESPAELNKAFEEIDRLETSPIEVAVQRESQELHPIVVFSALCLLFSLTLLRNTFFIELC